MQIFAIIDDTSVMNFRKNLQYNFPKNEGGGAMAVWNFYENSSILEGEGVPKWRFNLLSFGPSMSSRQVCVCVGTEGLFVFAQDPIISTDIYPVC